MPAKNEQFLPSETSKFCIETSVCPVVTKSSKTMMLRCGGMLLAVKTFPMAKLHKIYESERIIP